MDKLPEALYTQLDLKDLDENGSFTGYASVFDDVDEGGDIVKKGAFKKSLKARKPKMLFQHDPAQPIGVWNEVREDDKGLFVQGRILDKVAKGIEVLELMRAGVIDGLSIGFRTIRASRDKDGIRQLLEMDLWEISVVTFPMLESARVSGVKGDWTKRDVERVLRDAGMPNAMAVKLISDGFNAANTSNLQRDAGAGLNEIADSIRNATQLMKGA